MSLAEELLADLEDGDDEDLEDLIEARADPDNELRVPMEIDNFGPVTTSKHRKGIKF